VITIIKDMSAVGFFHKDPWRGQLHHPVVGPVNLVYLNKITLSPPVLFEHLNGSGLMKWLDRSQLSATFDDADRVIEEPIFRYIHGRSDVMKGTPSITSVLLGCPNSDVNEASWLSSLPSMWLEFQKIYKTA